MIIQIQDKIICLTDIVVIKKWFIANDVVCDGIMFLSPGLEQIVYFDSGIERDKCYDRIRKLLNPTRID